MTLMTTMAGLDVSMGKGRISAGNNRDLAVNFLLEATESAPGSPIEKRKGDTRGQGAK